MAAALFDNTAIDIEAKNKDDSYLLRTSSSVNKFPGFMILYTEGKDEDEEKGSDSSLPHLKKGDTLKLLDLIPQQRFTQPPSRYTEASLIKTLEQYGIGRPSTYAPILSTIQDREYITKIKGSFQATELGFVVNDLLAQYFADIVNIEFTASLENELDAVASENKDWTNVVQDFYLPLEKNLQSAMELAERVKLADELTDEVCPNCGKPLAVKTGRFGKFLACSGYPECKFTKPFMIKIGVKCPECGGELIQRMSKKKRIFFGCSNYPECRFISNTKPLPTPCPECGGLLTSWGKQSKCTKCNYKGKLQQD